MIINGIYETQNLLSL